jgi:hypothetical protein
MDASPHRNHDQCNSLAARPPRVRCRQITAADLDETAALLKQGFPIRSLSYWTQGLAKLGDHPTPPDCPKYGYVLEVEGRLVGVLLLISTALPSGDITITRCNVSSWYVQDSYRGFASLLITAAARKKHVTYINVSPAPHTFETIKMQGFTCCAEGQFYSFPIMTAPVGHVRIRTIERDVAATDSETEILKTHAGYGCLSIICETDGQRYPFIFLRRKLAHRLLPGAQLIYSRDIADFSRFAGNLGWFLLNYGMPCVIVNANGPIPGLAGRYYEGRGPKYYKGPNPPLLSDLAFSEMVLFGY